MSDCKSCKKEHHHRDCNKKSDFCCICLIIDKFVGEFVTIRTKSGDTIEGEIKAFDKKTKCVVIIEPEMVTPMIPARKIIICCEDIEYIAQDLLKHGHL